MPYYTLVYPLEIRKTLQAELAKKNVILDNAQSPNQFTAMQYELGSPPSEQIGKVNFWFCNHAS